MNPFAIALAIIALTMLVVGFRGKQDNLIAAVTGKKYGNSSLA